MNIYQHCVQV